MADRMGVRTFIALVVLAAFVVACAPQTVVVKKAVEVEKVVEKTVVVEQVVKETVGRQEVSASGTVVFMSWAEDAFEVQALVETVRAFQKAAPDVQIECTIATSVRVASEWQGRASDPCQIVAE